MRGGGGVPAIRAFGYPVRVVQEFQCRSRNDSELHKVRGTVNCRRDVRGTYFHGPVLSKNPALADWLIAWALRRRGIEEPLEALADAEEAGARRAFEKKLPHRA